jgi:hypothetical protein
MSLLLFSCNDWLDVQPKTTIKQERMFETEDGFKEVLTGAYIKLKGTNLYGTELTIKTIELLSQHWDVDPKSIEAAIEDYDYNDARVKDKIKNIYGGLYGVIANVNSLLEHIDSKKDVFRSGMYELVKGEALAIRAYCHFDILRLFGPVPKGTKTNVKLSYVKKVTKEAFVQVSYAEYIQLLLEDISQAEQLLKDVDPINSSNNLNYPATATTDSYFKYRTLDINYYAVLALKARYYLWVDNNPKAYEYAKMVIDAKNMNGGNKFKFTILNQNSGDFTFSSEHVFSIKKNLWNVSKMFFQRAGYGTLSKSRTLIKKDVFEHKLTDIRYGLFTNATQAGKAFFTNKKYWQVYGGIDILKKNVIPLIRLSELYFIAIEASPSLSESNALYEKFCTYRNNSMSDFTSKTEVLSTILKEYRKEFYGEGLMFYTYKRLNIKNVLWANREVTEDDYVIPLPDTEILY